MRSLMHWLVPFLGIVTLTSAAAIARRDADFFDVRTRVYKDMSGRAGDPEEKYFRKFISVSRCSCDAKLFD